MRDVKTAVGRVGVVGTGRAPSTGMLSAVGRGPARILEFRASPGTPQSAPEKHILVVLDGSPSSVPALRMGAALARSLGARVTLLRVLPIQTYGMSVYPTVMNDGRRVAIEIERLEALLKRTLRKHPDLLEPKLEIAFAITPHRMIAELAEKHGADLIVMGSDGGGRVSRFFFGSTAERTRRIARCPVLTAAPDTRSKILAS